MKNLLISSIILLSVSSANAFEVENVCVRPLKPIPTQQSNVDRVMWNLFIQQSETYQECMIENQHIREKNMLEQMEYQQRQFKMMQRDSDNNLRFSNN